jgi:hypothetical protein
MNDNINIESTIAGSIKDNINIDSTISGSMNDNINHREYNNRVNE